MFRPDLPRRLAVAALLVSCAAGAQSIAFSQNYERRQSSDLTKLATYRTASKNPDWINYQDCASNIALHFTLGLANIPSSGAGTFRVWAGTDDCKVVANRTGDSTRTCWPVSKDLDQTQTVTVDVLAQHVVGYIAKGAAEKPQSFSSLPTTASTDLCDSTKNGLTSTGPTAVKLWFMFTDGSGNVLGTPLEWATSVDINGPAAPTAVALTSGDSAINVGLTVSDSANDTSSEYVIYCYAQGTLTADAGASSADAGAADAGAADAGTTDAGTGDSGVTDAGTPSKDDAGPADAGTPSKDDAGASSADAGASNDAGAGSASCVAPWIPEPAAPLSAAFLQSIGAFECGRVGGASRSSRVTTMAADKSRLRNGVSYAVAVVGSDNVDNIGGIKSGGCIAPVDTVTFWDNYENAGGDAGGCSIGRPALSGPSLVLSALVGLAAALRLRRKGR